jgi:H+/Cl- antiporter ClcA
MKPLLLLTFITIATSATTSDAFQQGRILYHSRLYSFVNLNRRQHDATTTSLRPKQCGLKRRHSLFQFPHKRLKLFGNALDNIIDENFPSNRGEEETNVDVTTTTTVIPKISSDNNLVTAISTTDTQSDHAHHGVSVSDDTNENFDTATDAYDWNRNDQNYSIKLQYAAYDMTCAGIVGVATGIVVAYFKLSIESLRVFSYSLDILDSLHNEIGAILIPVVGGGVVGLILACGSLSPGLRGTISQMETITTTGDVSTTKKSDNVTTTEAFSTRLQQQIPLFRKTMAAVSTLGTGCSLGPEGPCVELGMGIARSCMDLYSRRPALQQRYEGSSMASSDVVTDRVMWHRILLSCGAAAGVSAGFDAPVAGVFFALEVIQSAFSDSINERNRMQSAEREMESANDESNGQTAIVNNVTPSAEGLFSSTSTLTPVLLSSVLSALCARSILGDHLTFNVANVYALSSSPLIELPLYLLLGAICGCVAFAFSQSAKFSRSFFEGEIGSEPIRILMRSISPIFKPVIGGLFCGVTALFFPQILFFGYETLNSILSNTVSIPMYTLLSLLFVKALATAVSIGSGLVGGTLAPALFLGGATGALFHNVMSDVYHLAAVQLNDLSHALNFVPLDMVFFPEKALILADLPAYAMVGSASVLAALFRAPLTASLLLFELSRDYDVILPIIASAGVGSVVADLLEDALLMKQQQLENTQKQQYKLRKLRRDQDSASWGDLSDKDDPKEQPNNQ